MNKQDRMGFERFRIEIENLGSSWDTNTKSIMELKDEFKFMNDQLEAFSGAWNTNTKSINAIRNEVHELQPRYDEIIKLIKNKGFKSMRSFDDLTSNEMSAWMETLSEKDLKNLRRYFPDKPLKFVKANDIQPNLNKRKTDKMYEVTAQTERRARPKILSFFGFGKLKVEL